MLRQELKNWQLRGYFGYSPLFSGSRETNALTRGVTLAMDITVPHDLYADPKNTKTPPEIRRGLFS